MTNIDEFYRIECDKIDPNCINAYAKLLIDEENPCELVLDTSWGQEKVNLTEAVKCGETCTELLLYPDECEEPTVLKYLGECGTYCIEGDDLSRIISLTKLKDVSQEKEPEEDDMLVFNGTKWEYRNISEAGTDLEELTQKVNILTERLNSLTASFNTIVNQFATIQREFNDLKNMIDRPEGIPEDARMVWGNINLYSDYTYGDLRTSGFYTHSIDENKINDEYFA